MKRPHFGYEICTKALKKHHFNTVRGDNLLKLTQGGKGVRVKGRGRDDEFEKKIQGGGGLLFGLLEYLV